MKSLPQHQVYAWQFQDVLLEWYDYAPGKAEVCEPHLHADYQLCLSFNFPGVYAYRGVNHAVPKGSLSILHPGDVSWCESICWHEGRNKERLCWEATL